MKTPYLALAKQCNTSHVTEYKRWQQFNSVLHASSRLFQAHPLRETLSRMSTTFSKYGPGLYYYVRGVPFIWDPKDGCEHSNKTSLTILVTLESRIWDMTRVSRRFWCCTNSLRFSGTCAMARSVDAARRSMSNDVPIASGLFCNAP